MGGTVYFVVGMDNGSATSFCANGVGAAGLGLGGGIEGFKDRGFWKSEMEQKMQRDGAVGERQLIKSDASVFNWNFTLPGRVTGTVVIENGERNLEVIVSSLSRLFAHQCLSKTADFIPCTRRPAGGCFISADISDQRPTLSMTYSRDKRTIFYGLEKGIAFRQVDDGAHIRASTTGLRTDIFDVYCLPPDAPSHTGFLAGGRDGTVRLFDVRANTQTCAPIVLKVGSVRHIGGLSGSGLVIRCVDSCARYDLRMTQGSKARGAKSYAASMFRVPDGDGRKGGFDIYHEVGLVAVEGGSGGNEKAVYLFDIDSSDLVAKFPPGQVKLLKPEGGYGWPAVVIAGERGVVVYE
ncbi:hypothetical protein HOY80DRAFT_890490 [Tuber brumale]|nr:hypothetical protein HOY80DRAFT_890490 [Tuber brumale]